MQFHTKILPSDLALVILKHAVVIQDKTEKMKTT